MNSCGSLPVAFFALSASGGSSLRLALARSAVPLIRAAIPIPEPPPETSTDTPGSTLPYSSAQAWARFTMVSEPMSWMDVFLAVSVFLQPAARKAAAAIKLPAAMKRAGVVALVMGSSLLVAQDGLDQVLDVGAQESVGLVVGGPDLLRTAGHLRGVADAPVETDHLGGGRGEHPAGLLGERHDHLVVVQVGDLLDGAAAVAGDVDPLLPEEGEGRLVESPGVEAGAAEDELGLAERVADPLGHLAAAGVVLVDEQHPEHLRAPVLGVFAGADVEHLLADALGLIGHPFEAVGDGHQRGQRLDGDLPLRQRRHQVGVDPVAQDVHLLLGLDGPLGQVGVLVDEGL